MSNNKVFVSKVNLQTIWAEIKAALDSKADADSLSTYVAQCSEVLTDIQTMMGASTYDSTATYSLNDYCIYQNKLYRCTTAITTAEAWNAAHWTETSFTSESARILSKIQDEGDRQVTAVQEEAEAQGLSVVNGRLCMTYTV